MSGDEARMTDQTPEPPALPASGPLPPYGAYPQPAAATPGYGPPGAPAYAAAPVPAYGPPPGYGYPPPVVVQVAGGGTTTGHRPLAEQSLVAALLLCLFLGPLGIHRFYARKIGSGLAMLLLSLTLVGTLVTVVWALVDLVVILC